MEKSATSGEHAYIISKTADYLIAEGSYGEVYKIYTKNEKKVYAAKFFK